MTAHGRDDGLDKVAVGLAVLFDDFKKSDALSYTGAHQLPQRLLYLLAFLKLLLHATPPGSARVPCACGCECTRPRHSACANPHFFGAHTRPISHGDYIINDGRARRHLRTPGVGPRRSQGGRLQPPRCARASRRGARASLFPRARRPPGRDNFRPTRAHFFAQTARIVPDDDGVLCARRAVVTRRRRCVRRLRFRARGHGAAHTCPFPRAAPTLATFSLIFEALVTRPRTACRLRAFLSAAASVHGAAFSVASARPRVNLRNGGEPRAARPALLGSCSRRGARARARLCCTN